MVVGCLSPDFEYFFRLAPGGGYGHTWLGVLVMDLPLSLLVLWFYEGYGKVGLYTIAPGLFPFREEELEARPVARGLSQWMVVIVSILLGATTHIVWDSFTHNHFWPYTHIAFLRASLPTLFGHEFRMYGFLQFASSVVGMVVLFAMWVKWIGNMKEPGVPMVRRLGIVLLGVAVLAGILRTIAIRHTAGRLSITADGVVTFFTAILLLIGLVGLWRRRMPE
jgi:hypothetical protein